MTMSVSCGLRTKSRGFTLTELAIVLSIMGLILGSIWTAASKVYFNQKVTKAVTETLTLVEGIKAAFPNGSVPTSTNAVLSGFVIDSGIAPGEMIQPSASCPTTTYSATNSQDAAGNCLFGPFQNQVIAGWGGGFYTVGGDARHFEVATSGANFTPTQCAGFISAFVPAAVNDGLTLVYINGTSDNPNTTSITDLVKLCSTVSPPAILFQFSL